MQERICGNEYRTTMIYVDSYQGSNPAGRFYNPYMNSVQSFSSLMDLILKVEGLLNEMNFPQSFSAVRSFSKTAKLDSNQAGSDQPEGRVASFAVKVMFRQNASWQGSVTWLEGKAEESFRSALELMFLMDSACRN